MLEVKDSLQNNRSIPLFSMSQNVEFLKNFIRYPDYNLRLDLKINQFITLAARLAARLAAPQATQTEQQQPREGENLTEKSQAEQKCDVIFST